MSKTDRVASINIYPFKSAQAATIGGEVPTSLPVGKTGFEVHGVRDRDFVLYDVNEGCFVSQRGWGADGRRVKHPQDRTLAAVAIDIQPDHMTVTSPVGKLEVPTAISEGGAKVLDIFGKQLPVIKQGDDAALYFSLLLGREVELMRSDREHPRILPEKYQREGAFNQVAAADGMSFLLVNETSLIFSHIMTDTPLGQVPINRYRGNIVVKGDGDGLGAYAEDYIDPTKQFRIGEIGAWVVKACSRCPIPNIDQVTGEQAGGALKVLRGRYGQIFTGEEGVFFGQNVVHANEGVISIDDPVVVEHFADEPNITFRYAA
jgi:uncharacterized protein YcbX